MKTASSLTWGLYNAYGGRKKPGYLAVVVNLKENVIYPIPTNEEHADFISKRILGTSKNELSMHPEWAEKIIPSIIEIDDISGKVKGVLTGVSGVEIGYRVRHDKEDIEKAHAKVIEFLKNGEIPFAEGFRAIIQYKYARK